MVYIALFYFIVREEKRSLHAWVFKSVFLKGDDKEGESKFLWKVAITVTFPQFTFSAFLFMKRMYISNIRAITKQWRDSWRDNIIAIRHLMGKWKSFLIEVLVTRKVQYSPQSPCCWELCHRAGITREGSRLAWLPRRRNGTRWVCWPDRPVCKGEGGKIKETIQIP